MIADAAEDEEASMTVTGSKKFPLN